MSKNIQWDRIPILEDARLFPEWDMQIQAIAASQFLAIREINTDTEMEVRLPSQEFPDTWPEPFHVKVNGQNVTTLVNKPFNPAKHEQLWRKSNEDLDRAASKIIEQRGTVLSVYNSGIGETFKAKMKAYLDQYTNAIKQQQSLKFYRLLKTVVAHELSDLYEEVHAEFLTIVIIGEETLTTFHRRFSKLLYIVRTAAKEVRGRVTYSDTAACSHFARAIASRQPEVEFHLRIFPPDATITSFDELTRQLPGICNHIQTEKVRTRKEKVMKSITSAGVVDTTVAFNISAHPEKATDPQGKLICQQFPNNSICTNCHQITSHRAAQCPYFVGKDSSGSELLLTSPINGAAKRYCTICRGNVGHSARFCTKSNANPKNGNGNGNNNGNQNRQTGKFGKPNGNGNTSGNHNNGAGNGNRGGNGDRNRNTDTQRQQPDSQSGNKRDRSGKKIKPQCAAA